MNHKVLLILMLIFFAGFSLGVAFENTRDIQKINEVFDSIPDNASYPDNLFKVNNQKYIIERVHNDFFNETLKYP